MLRFPNRQELVRRFPPLVAGLFIIGFSIAISVRARTRPRAVGRLPPGRRRRRRNLSIGLVVVLVGLVVLLAWIPLRQQLGIGTILNTLSIGLIANLGLALIPDQHAIVIRSRSSRSRSSVSVSAAASTSARGSGPARATG